MKLIYHVTSAEEWNDFLAKPEYAPRAYSQDGFIHACSKDQLAGVLKRYFKAQKNLLLLHIRENALDHPVKYEPSTGGELFPHIFGGINKAAIEKVEGLPDQV